MAKSRSVAGSKRFTHISFSNANSEKWREKFEEAGVPVTNKHEDLICQAVAEAVKEFEA